MNTSKQEKSLIKQNILRYLSESGVSAYEFYKKSGVTRGVLQQSNGISEDNLTRFLAYAPEVSPDWLLTGTGEMLRAASQHPSSTTPSEHTPAPMERIDAPGTPGAIPLVTHQAACGLFSPSHTIMHSDVDSFFLIPSFRHLSVDFLIEATGDSMTPHIHPGDIIACAILHNAHFIQWGRPHLISTSTQGLLIKRLMPTEQPHHLTATSDNPAYPPFTLPKSEVIGIARIVGTIHIE